MIAKPRNHTPRSDLPTRGAGVDAIARAKRAPQMQWQRKANDVALEYDPETGLYRYDIVVESVPRQSGKTKSEGDVADHRCLSLPRARVWITMQNGKTVDSWMRSEHFASLAGARAFGIPGTATAKYQLTKRAGEVGVLWPALGSSFLTFPPKRDALHSKQSDLVLVDEAWAHNAETGADIRQAVRPTMATRPGSQLWIVSTLGDDASTFFDDYYQLGLASLVKPDTRVCFIDYGIPDDADPENLDVIAAHHPAYCPHPDTVPRVPGTPCCSLCGNTIRRPALEAAREEFGDDVAGWARAYGNRATRTRETAIPASVWNTAGTPRIDVPDRAGIALDVTPSGDRAAIAAAWRDGDQAYVELLHAGPPARELPQLLVDLCRRRRVPLVVDRGSFGALEVIDAVARIAPTLEVRYLSLAEYAQACGTFHRGIYDQTVRHFHDPALTAAVEVATKINKGDGGFGWGRKESAGSIAELVAATVALKAFDQLPRQRRITTVISAR